MTYLATTSRIMNYKTLPRVHSPHDSLHLVDMNARNRLTVQNPASAHRGHCPLRSLHSAVRIDPFP